MYICIYVYMLGGPLDNYSLWTISLCTSYISLSSGTPFPHFKRLFFHTSSLNFPHFKPQFSTLPASIFHTSSLNFPHFKPQFSTLQASIFHTSSLNFPHFKPQYSTLTQAPIFPHFKGTIFHTSRATFSYSSIVYSVLDCPSFLQPNILTTNYILTYIQTIHTYK